MVKIYTEPSRRSHYSRKTEPVQRSSEQMEQPPVVEREVFVERRRNPDRRNERRDRGPFDMRSGRDRRKNPPGRPSVDLKV